MIRIYRTGIRPTGDRVLISADKRALDQSQPTCCLAGRTIGAEYLRVCCPVSVIINLSLQAPASATDHRLRPPRLRPPHRRHDRRPPVTRAVCGPGPACHRVPTSWTHGQTAPPPPLIGRRGGVFLVLGSHVAAPCQADPTFTAYPYSPRALWAARRS